jgi:hypothetical protein
MGPLTFLLFAFGFPEVAGPPKRSCFFGFRKPPLPQPVSNFIWGLRVLCLQELSAVFVRLLSRLVRWLDLVL